MTCIRAKPVMRASLKLLLCPVPGTSGDPFGVSQALTASLFFSVFHFPCPSSHLILECTLIFSLVLTTPLDSHTPAPSHGNLPGTPRLPQLHPQDTHTTQRARLPPLTQQQHRRVLQDLRSCRQDNQSDRSQAAHQGRRQCRQQHHTREREPTSRLCCRRHERRPV